MKQSLIGINGSVFLAVCGSVGNNKAAVVNRQVLGIALDVHNSAVGWIDCLESNIADHQIVGVEKGQTVVFGTGRGITFYDRSILVDTSKQFNTIEMGTRHITQAGFGDVFARVDLDGQVVAQTAFHNGFEGC